MADEMVDVINENDEVIRQEWKSKCHAEGLFHRISSVYLFTSDDKIWLQKRAKGKIGEGMFDSSAAGHVGVGESYEKAAYKELEEELGVKTELKLLANGLIERWDFFGIKIRHISSMYLGFHDGPFNLQEEELESVEAYSIEEIKKMLIEKPNKFTEGLKVQLKELLKEKWK